MNKQYEIPAYIRRERDGLLKTLGEMGWLEAERERQALFLEVYGKMLRRELRIKLVYQVMTMMIAAAAAWLAGLLAGEMAGLLMRSFFESGALWGGVWLACTKVGLV